MNRFVLAVLLCINWASLVLSQRFSYNPNAVDGPSNWAGDCSTGKKQSPIDIKSANATIDKGLGTFTLKNYDKKLNKTFSASNNGHALEMVFPERVYNVSGGGLTDVYTTVQFHFHWGADNSVGSEHTVNGKQYAAELHFVSYNTKYASLSEAVSKPDGLAVLGLLIEVGETNNTAFSFLEKARNLVETFSAIDDVPAFTFEHLLPDDKTKFFRYSGSLTTPTCLESVTWTVFNDHVKISQYQMNLLRALKKNETSPRFGNYRPVQPLNNRIVKASFPVSKMNTTSNTTTANTTDVTTTTITKTVTTTITVTATITATGTKNTIPTEFGGGAPAVSMTSGLFLSMLSLALFVH